MKILGVIPARYASTRFPGKPLTDIAGKSMIQRVYEQASKAQGLQEVYVATDDDRIFQHVQDFGGKVLMTDSSHPTGTDRILEVTERMPDFDAYINIQGDEPFIAPEQIDLVGEVIKEKGKEEKSFVATLVKRLEVLDELENPNMIKAVKAADGRAIYFSRSPIPYMRNAENLMQWHQENGYYKHIGIYGYTSAALVRIRAMAPGILERAESLEQLRWMENGLPIYTAETELETMAVDTPEDVDRILAWLQA